MDFLFMSDVLWSEGRSNKAIQQSLQIQSGGLSLILQPSGEGAA